MLNIKMLPSSVLIMHLINVVIHAVISVDWNGKLVNAVSLKKSPCAFVILATFLSMVNVPVLMIDVIMATVPMSIVELDNAFERMVKMFVFVDPEPKVMKKVLHHVLISTNVMKKHMAVQNLHNVQIPLAVTRVDVVRIGTVMDIKHVVREKIMNAPIAATVVSRVNVNAISGLDVILVNVVRAMKPLEMTVSRLMSAPKILMNATKMQNVSTKMVLILVNAKSYL